MSPSSAPLRAGPLGGSPGAPACAMPRPPRNHTTATSLSQSG
eukprot:CAMPEP_0171105860 /NCGR_PEP_ID=MMETSP0766_2-20121228/63583_1 /TAXON_ID=439317 /ORGANISM="Gambierdiscus australes, Strain CAWD 149" /LENGTH=41 /DNA_ID= /DNA_START= /DNA_END= /DNA_ORIENTATION=